MISKNYGRKGGELDNTKHLEAGARALCNPSELRLRGFQAGPVMNKTGYGQAGLIGGVPAPPVGEPEENGKL